MSWQLGAFRVLALAWPAGFAWYERVAAGRPIVALVGTLAAFAALGRIAFAAVPNVKPTTDIVLISGYALGGGPGFAVGALAGADARTSSSARGRGRRGRWPAGGCRDDRRRAGLGGFGACGAGLGASGGAARAAGGGAGRLQPPPLGRWPLAVVCCVVGFAFTALQDVGDWVTYSDHSASQLGATSGQGLGFDAIHAAGCLVFALAFGPALIRSIQRFARRTAGQLGRAGWGRAPVIAVVVGGADRPPGGSGRAAASAARLRAALALRRRPRCAAPRSPTCSAAQNADGGFGAAPGQPSNQLYAGWAALGLASAGYDLARVASGAGLIAYIERGAGSPADVGSLERTILVARAAGLSAAQLRRPRSGGRAASDGPRRRLGLAIRST